MDSQVKWSSGLARGSIAAGGSPHSVGILRIHSSTAKQEEFSVRLLKQFLRNIKGVPTISRVCPISNGLGFFCVIALFVNDFFMFIFLSYQMSILSTVIDIVIICGPLIFYFPANFKEKAPSSQAQGFRKY